MGVEGGGRAATVSPARTRFLKKLRDKVEYILINILFKFSAIQFGTFWYVPYQNRTKGVGARPYIVPPHIKKKIFTWRNPEKMMEYPENEDILGTPV